MDAPDSTLLGREQELAEIEGILSRAQRGESGALALVGPAGQGKTTLLQHAAHLAEHSEPPMRVLRARGIESEAELAFAGLLELIRPLRELVERLPEQQARSLEGALALGEAGATDRFSVSAATLGILALAAEEAAVLVIVDDLQWLDPPSAGAILFAARRLWREGIAILVGSRPDDAVLNQLEGLTRLDLGPLAPGPAGALARASAQRALSDTEVAALVAGTGGNALGIVEAARDVGVTTLPVGGDVVPIPVAESIRVGVERRLRALAPHQRWAVLLAATAGSRSATTLLEAALSADGLSLTELAGAEREGLLRVHPGTVEFEHPLSRSAVYVSSEPDERRRAHRLIASVSGEGSAERAWHLAAAAVGPDETAADALELVGNDALTRGAPSTALRAFERAASLTRDTEPAARRLLLAGNAARLAGFTDQAREAIRNARERSRDPLTRADALGLLFQIDTWRAPVATARVIAAESEQLAELDAVRAARMLAEAAAALARTGSIPQGVEFAERAHAEITARGLQDDAVELSLLFARVMDARAPEAIEPLCDLGVRLRAAPPSAQTLALIQQVAWMQIWVERYEEAEALLEYAVAVGRQQAAGALPMALAMRGELGYRRGRLQASLADTSEAASLATDFGQAHARGLALTCQSRTEAVLGREADCRATAHEAAALGAQLGGVDSPVSAYGAPALGLLELGLENPEAAVPHLERLVRTFQAGGIREPGVVLSTGDLIEAYAGAGRTQDARSLLEGFADLADRTQRTGARAIAARCRGLLSDGADAEAAFIDALRLHGDGPMPFEKARTQLAFAEWLGGAGRLAEARDLFVSAADTFRRIGAAQWEMRASRELGEAATADGATGTEHLSAQELQVARVAAAAASTPEAGAQLFLSARTVEAHLEQVYRKLGVRSVAELADSMWPEGVSDQLELVSLGGFGVKRDGRVVDDQVLGGSEGRTTLAILAASGGPVTREELTGWVFPGDPSAAASGRLAEALDHLRQALGPQRLHQAADRIQLSLQDGDRWDLGTVLADAGRITSTDGRSAVEDMLARLSSPPFPEWQGAEWLAPLEARCVAELCRLRGVLAEILMAEGQHEAALAHFAALADAQPVEQAWHRGVMRCHAAAGNVPLALRQYHDCRSAVRVLSDEDPDAETQALYLELLRR
ncbi:MAG: AAA family ATPase [Thermoleophilia bacterium]